MVRSNCVWLGSTHPKPSRTTTFRGRHEFDRHAAIRLESCSRPRLGALQNPSFADAWLGGKTAADARRGAPSPSRVKTKKLGCGVVF